jgi:hypothetical protein
MSVEEKMRLMKTLDDAWNNQDWDTFSHRHTEDVVVRWPSQSEPTRGLDAHRNEGVQMFEIFLTTLFKTIRIMCFLVKVIGLVQLRYSQVFIEGH